MTDKELAVQRKRLTKVLNELRDQLGFKHWDVTHHLHRAKDPESPGRFSSTVCWTESRWEYRRIEMNWFMPAVADLCDRDLRYCAAHEYAHAWLSRTIIGTVSDELRKLHELSATDIGWAIVWSEEAAAKRALSMKKAAKAVKVRRKK